MLVKIACWSDRRDGSQLRGMQKIGEKWDEVEREGWGVGTKGIACSPKNEEQERNLLPVSDIRILKSDIRNTTRSICLWPSVRVSCSRNAKRSFAKRQTHRSRTGVRCQSSLGTRCPCDPLIKHLWEWRRKFQKFLRVFWWSAQCKMELTGLHDSYGS